MADQHKKQLEAQKKPALSNYERSLVKSSQPRKRVGKGVPQLGEVSKPVPPLIVPNQYGSVGKMRTTLPSDTTYREPSHTMQ